MSRMIINPYSFGSVAPPELSFIGYTEDPAQRTTYNFSAVPIGAEHPSRRVIVVAHWGDSTAFRTLNAASINGASLFPAHVIFTSGQTISGGNAIFSALVPTGPTANFSFTLSAAAASMDFAIGIFRAINETMAAPHATMADNSVSGNTLSGTIDIPNNGWVLAAGTWFGLTVPAPPNAMAWTGVTEQYEETRGDSAVPVSSALSSGLPLQLARPISMVGSAASIPQGAICAISWG